MLCDDEPFMVLQLLEHCCMLNFSSTKQIRGADSEDMWISELDTNVRHSHACFVPPAPPSLHPLQIDNNMPFSHFLPSLSQILHPKHPSPSPPTPDPTPSTLPPLTLAKSKSVLDSLADLCAFDRVYATVAALQTAASVSIIRRSWFVEFELRREGWREEGDKGGEGGRGVR